MLYFATETEIHFAGERTNWFGFPDGWRENKDHIQLIK